MADFQDDLSESFDDGSEEQGLSDAEYQQRLDAYQKALRRNMKKALKPKQFKPAERREAIQWLGETGAADAIPALVKVYRKDKTPGMKDEAAEALGMLKALGYEFEDPETTDDAYQRLERVQIHGELGGRANQLVWIAIEAVLALMAIALVVGALVVDSTVGEENRIAEATSIAATETARPTATPDTIEVVEAQLQSYYTALVADAATYQAQLLAASRGDGQNCDVTFEYPTRYELSATWQGDERFEPIVENLNAVHTQLDSVLQPWLTACTNNQPIERQQALDLGSIILDAQRTLRETAPQLENIGIAVPTQAFATATPAPTDAPQATATPNLTAARPHIIALDNLIADLLNQVNGPTTTTAFYWEQAINNEALYREGCLQPEPEIPPVYRLPDDIAAQFPQLQVVADNVNTAINATNGASSAFYAACNAGSLPEDAAARLAQAQNAVNALNLAQTTLGGFR